LSVKSIAQAFLDNLLCVYERYLEVSSVDDQYRALARTIRDHLLHRWVQTIRTYQKVNPRTVCYLSAEYLPGPLMDNNLLSLGIKENTREALASLGIDLNNLIAYEVEPGLGNGGLGRLASCFLDSLATLQMSAIGYGIRYEFGIFSQLISNGEQVECTDTWLHFGNPWEIRRPHIAHDVKIGGHTQWYLDSQGRSRVRWVEREVFRGVAVDTAIAGHGVKTVNLLRLWSAEAMEAFDFRVFNEGDYAGAVMRGVRSATISKILYPNDEPEIGKRLRPPPGAPFRHVFLAGYAAYSPKHGSSSGILSHQIRRPAQRHTPGHCRGRAHAVVGRRARVNAIPPLTSLHGRSSLGAGQRPAISWRN
jgi:starch phosphorylase